MAKKDTFDFSKPISKRQLSSEFMYKYIEKNGSEEELDSFCVVAFDDNDKVMLANARNFFIEHYPDMVSKPDKKKKKTTIDIMRERRRKVLENR